MVLVPASPTSGTVLDTSLNAPNGRPHPHRSNIVSSDCRQSCEKIALQQFGPRPNFCLSSDSFSPSIILNVVSTSFNWFESPNYPKNKLNSLKVWTQQDTVGVKAPLRAR